MLSNRRLSNRLFYGWVIVAAFLAIGIICYGINSSFGVFLKTLAAEFILTRATTSTIFSTQLAFGYAFAIIGGWALDRYGLRNIVPLIGLSAGLGLLLSSQVNAAWQLFITYGLLVSLGTGPIWVVTTATTTRWFDKKRGLALGIASSGIGIGAVVMAPFVTYLISSFGWRIAYIVLALIAWLIVIPISRVLKRDPYEIGALPDGVKSSSGEMGLTKPKKEDKNQLTGLSLREASGTRNFWLFGSIWLLYAFCFFLILTHIVPHATDVGILPMQAATVLSMIGGSNIAGRLILGRLSDSVGRKKTASICALFVAVAMIWLIWSQDLWMFYLFGIVFGFFHGGLEPSAAALLGDTFGMHSIGIIIGTLEIAWGIGAATGPAIGGLIFDISKSYSTAFLVCALCMLIAALLIALIRRDN